MSQRSHIAQSGSSAIIACSAAWSVPSSARILEAASIHGSGTNQTASVSNVVSGRSSAHEIEGRLVADRLLLVGDHLLGDAHRSEQSSRPSRSSLACAALDRGHRLLLRLRVVVAAERLDERRTR